MPALGRGWGGNVTMPGWPLGLGHVGSHVVEYVSATVVSSGIGALDSLGFMSRSAKRREQVRETLHVSPRTAPSQRGRALRISPLVVHGAWLCAPFVAFA